jgi:hypothetical protein
MPLFQLCFPSQQLTFISKPETYDRPALTQEVLVKDITGEEDKYTLDSHGFQIYRHSSKEKDFLDEDKIKAEYYPEIEQLLKDAYVLNLELASLCLGS